IERLKRKFGAAIVTHTPKVPYKETIRGKTQVHGRYKKQTGGHGMFGDVWLELEPNPDGGVEFAERVVGGAVPKGFFAGVEKGIREAAEGGVIAGYPLSDFRATLYDGSFHPVDSNELSFKIAASMALKDGVHNARSARREPIMAVEIRVPDAYMGEVNRDLNGRRGRVLGMDTDGDMQVISAHVPQAELFNYATEVRSLAQGRGYVTATLDHYDDVPGHIAEKVMDAHRKELEAAGGHGGLCFVLDSTRMRPTPVTFSSPNAPSTYSWEATDEEVAARYGLDASTIVRFDLNTSPTPPDLATRLLAVGRFVAPLSEYPPTDYRALIEAAAARYGVTPAEILVGAGADEILDIVAKVFIPPGGRAIVPIPTYAMYRVLTEQRGATVVAVPRQGEAAGWAIDLSAVRAATADHDAAVVWLCSPNNPTALPEPEGAIASLLAGLAEDAGTAGGSAPAVVLDEAYAEFVGTTLIGLRDVYPNLIVVRTASKAYALAGLRVGFAGAPPEVIARMNPFRPPGSISTVSVTLVTEALRDDSILDDNLARVETERTRLADGLQGIGW